MDYSIKQNDSFFAIRKSLETTSFEVQKSLIKAIDYFEIEIESEYLGSALSEILENNEIEIIDFVNKNFPSLSNNNEFLQIIPSLIIWGDGSENPCDNCGSELDIEPQQSGKYKWNDYECPICHERTSNEPDWDSLPGGHDYY